MSKLAMVGCVVLASWAAISLTSPASSICRPRNSQDALVVRAYVDHISAIAVNFERLAGHLEQVDDSESAQSACRDLRPVMSQFEALLSRLSQLPRLAPDEAKRVRQLFEDGLRGRLDTSLQRFIAAAAHAAEHANGVPEIQTLADEFRAMSQRIEDALPKS